MIDDDLRHVVAQHSAFEAFVWALARTHPDQEALTEAFKETAEIMKTHLLNLAVPEIYLEVFEATRKRILSKMVAPE